MLAQTVAHTDGQTFRILKSVLLRCCCLCPGRNNADRNVSQVDRVVSDADLQGLPRQEPQDQDRNTNRQTAEHETRRVSRELTALHRRNAAKS